MAPPRLGELTGGDLSAQNVVPGFHALPGPACPRGAEIAIPTALQVTPRPQGSTNSGFGKMAYVLVSLAAMSFLHGLMVLDVFGILFQLLG